MISHCYEQFICLPFLCLPSNAFPDIGSVGRIRKTTRREPKINMAEKLAGIVAKLRQRGKKDQPPKLLCDIKMA